MALLRLGSASSDVTALQQRLQQLGLYSGHLDGQFGPGTEAAVTAFQQSKGLASDGIVGPSTAAALGLPSAVPSPQVVSDVTAEIVSQMFPVTPRANIEANLPFVLRALIAPALTDKPMILMSLATIRAETESFQPISEFPSQYNTSPGGHPFDLYDNRANLGNQGPPDGFQYRGRGFIQLTGRANYQVCGNAIGLGDQLVQEPELANDPDIAARLLASFLERRETQIRQALAAGDLASARRLVNGGTFGVDKFTDAYQRGLTLVPDNPRLQSA